MTQRNKEPISRRFPRIERVRNWRVTQVGLDPQHQPCLVIKGDDEKNALLWADEFVELPRDDGWDTKFHFIGFLKDGSPLTLRTRKTVSSLDAGLDPPSDLFVSNRCVIEQVGGHAKEDVLLLRDGRVIYNALDTARNGFIHHLKAYPTGETISCLRWDSRVRPLCELPDGSLYLTWSSWHFEEKTDYVGLATLQMKDVHFVKNEHREAVKEAQCGIVRLSDGRIACQAYGGPPKLRGERWMLNPPITVGEERYLPTFEFISPLFQHECEYCYHGVKKGRLYTMAIPPPTASAEP